MCSPFVQYPQNLALQKLPVGKWMRYYVHHLDVLVKGLTEATASTSSYGLLLCLPTLLVNRLALYSPLDLSLEHAKVRAVPSIVCLPFITPPRCNYPWIYGCY